MSKDTEVIRTTVGDFISGDVVIGAYINGEYSITLPQKSDGYIVEKVVCDNNAIGEWNYEEWSLITKNITTKSKCNVYFKDDVLANYDYSDSEEVFTVPISGTYKLEAWGAQGGGGGGFGYIGNSLLTEKVMYCYECTESTEENTKTTSTTCKSETSDESCSKEGNGYAKITLINTD